MRFDSLAEMPPWLREKVEAEIRKQDAQKAQKNKNTPSQGNFGTQENGSSQTKNDSAEEEPKKSKYGNRKTEVNGVKFDSKREAERYTVLLMRLQIGEIGKLKLQPEFTIMEAYIKPNGERVRAERYRADFSYVLPSGEVVIEDVKTEGTMTRVFLNKRKLVEEKYGFEIRLV